MPCFSSVRITGCSSGAGGRLLVSNSLGSVVLLIWNRGDRVANVALGLLLVSDLGLGTPDHGRETGGMCRCGHLYQATDCWSRGEIIIIDIIIITITVITYVFTTSAQTASLSSYTQQRNQQYEIAEPADEEESDKRCALK